MGLQARAVGLAFGCTCLRGARHPVGRADGPPCSLGVLGFQRSFHNVLSSNRFQRQLFCTSALLPCIGNGVGMLIFNKTHWSRRRGADISKPRG